MSHHIWYRNRAHVNLNWLIERDLGIIPWVLKTSKLWNNDFRTSGTMILTHECRRHEWDQCHWPRVSKVNKIGNLQWFLESFSEYFRSYISWWWNRYSRHDWHVTFYDRNFRLEPALLNTYLAINHKQLQKRLWSWNVPKWHEKAKGKKPFGLCFSYCQPAKVSLSKNEWWQLCFTSYFRLKCASVLQEKKGYGLSLQTWIWSLRFSRIDNVETGLTKPCKILI